MVDVLISDSASPTPNMVDAEATIGASKTVTLTFNVDGLIDGTLTVAATVTNIAGNSTSATAKTLKNTAGPPLSVTTPPAINNSNDASFPISATGTASNLVTYSITDGTSTISGMQHFSPTGTWSTAVSLATLKDGLVTLTVTETASNGNKTVYTEKLVDSTTPLATPTVVLNPTSDSGPSNSDYVTNDNKPQFIVTTEAGTTATVYVNGVAYTGQALANGSYTVTVIATNEHGNVSPTGTAPKTLIIDTAPPAGGFTIAGAKTINSKLVTASETANLELAFTDLSAIVSVEVSTNGGKSFAAPVAYSSSLAASLGSGDGLRTIELRLSDLAGNTSTTTLEVRLDTTAPTISASLSAPQSAVGYSGTANIAATISASDPSGATTTVKLDSSTFTGSTINVYTLLAGTHTITITSIDGVGNTSVKTITFELHPSRKGIAAAVKVATEGHLITAAGETKLLATLDNSANTLLVDLEHFIAEAKAQSGLAIKASEATILINWAEDDLKTQY
jgi:hypothetical protein